MQENTNKIIAVNSLIMYIQTGLSLLIGLFTARLSLQALGVVDYGLFSVLGSIMSFIAVFNGIMMAAGNRFLAVAVGKGDINEINRTFNVINLIYFICALLLLIIAIPIGHWYVMNKLNYDGPNYNAIIVLYFSIFASVLSTLASSYNSLLVAKERFFLFSFTDIVLKVLNLFFTLALVYYLDNKLVWYTIWHAITTILPTLVYCFYCHHKFREIVHFHICKEWKYYKEIFDFTAWSGFGAVACLIRAQAAAIIVNNFFNTVMNTSLGIANSINGYILRFADNFSKPMQPQITKSYVAGNHDRTDELLIMATKFSFLIMLLFSAPFFVSGEWIVNIWLGRVPEYSVAFIVLLVIDNLVQSFNIGLNLVIFADGRIARYQIIVNSLRIAAVAAAYFAIKVFRVPYFLFFAYILFSVFIVFGTQYSLQKTLNYNLSKLYKNSYIPSLIVTLFFLPCLLLPKTIHPFFRIIITISFLLIIEFTIGLSKKERLFVMKRIPIIRNYINV